MVRRIQIAAFLTTVVGLQALGQVENRQAAYLAKPAFYVDALCFAAGDTLSSRLDLYIQVPYEALRFLKEMNGFVSKYEVTVDILDSGQDLLQEKTLNEEIHEEKFDQTISERGFNLTQSHFELSPGKYSLVVQVRDKDSDKVFRIEKDIFVPTFSHRTLSISDIMLVGHINVEGEKKIIQPIVSGNVGNLSDDFNLFFEVYNGTDLRQIEITYRIFNAKKQAIVTKSEVQPLEAGPNQFFIPVDRSGLPLGNYVLSVQTRPPEDSLATDEYKSLIAVSTRWLQVHWAGMPTTINDLSLAIDQLVYLAKDRELDHIKEASTEKERMERFREFWKRYDPSPNSERNERMEEYFGRVEYANQHFSHYIDGWKTDMGMVFIILGSPNNVDRHPFEVDSKPYEVWSYYDINRQFVFVDETGFGDYRLITPFWDLWNNRR